MTWMRQSGLAALLKVYRVREQQDQQEAVRPVCRPVFIQLKWNFTSAVYASLLFRFYEEKLLRIIIIIIKW